MASRAVASIAFLLSLNLLFFTLVTSTYYPPQSEGYEPNDSNYPSPPQSEGYEPNDSNYPSPPLEGYEPNESNYPSPSEEAYEPYYPNNPSSKCPRDTLKLGVCVNLFKDLLGVTVGTPPKTPCCSLIGDLVDLEAAVCLCTTIKASLLGINLTVPIDLSLLLNYCGKQVPEGFMCA